MKKIYILLCLVAISITKSNSQGMAVSSLGLSEFLTSTVNVPITGNASYDDALKNAFSKYWKITPYKFLGTSEYAKLEKENGKKFKSFLFEIQYFGFSITHISSLPLFYQSNEGFDFFDKNKKFDHVQYRIEYIVKAMNDMITFTRDNKLGDDGSQRTLLLEHTTPTAKEKKYHDDVHYQLCALFNTNSKIIKDKTLILNRDLKWGRKSIFNEDVFSKYYPYSFKFVSDMEFNEILKGEQKENVCFIPSYFMGYQVNSIPAFMFIYEPATRSTIYMWYSKAFAKKITKEDIDQLKKTITK